MKLPQNPFEKENEDISNLSTIIHKSNNKPVEVTIEEPKNVRRAAVKPFSQVTSLKKEDLPVSLRDQEKEKLKSMFKTGTKAK